MSQDLASPTSEFLGSQLNGSLFGGASQKQIHVQEGFLVSRQL